jgi:hypothetical protein
MNRSTLQLAVFCISITCGLPRAEAQVSPANAATAHVLFEEGRRLMGDKKYELACPKLEDSQRLDPGMGTLFNLADCWEHIGRTASAWVRFLEVAETARASNDKLREKAARDRAIKLEPKLAKITIQVERHGSSGLRVLKDGSLVGACEWGTAVPIDPGEHMVEASAPGKEPKTLRINVAVGEAKVVSIPILEDAHAGPTPLPASAGSPPEGRAPAPGDLETPKTETSPQQTIGYAIGGAGVAGLVVGTAFALKQHAKNQEALDLCPNSHCTDDTEQQLHEDKVDEAKSARTVAIVGFAAGGVAIVTGAVLVLTAPKQPEAKAVRLVPVVREHQAGLALTGRW